MLRLSIALRTAATAAALFAGSASFGQSGGLSGRITDAGTKLDQDVQACRPVDLGEPQRLLHDAAVNKQRAEKAAKKGVPIDQAQVDADLANANALFNRAVAANTAQCMRQAQEQAQPQPQTTPTPTTTPTPAQTSRSGASGTDTRIEDAERKLAEDVRNCRAINSRDYLALVYEAERNLIRASSIESARIPIDRAQLNADYERAKALYARARVAEATRVSCPPKREAQTEPPKTTGSLPSPVPASGASGSGSCPAARPASEGDPGPRIPTRDDVNKIAEDMERAQQQSHYSEAEFLRSGLERQATDLSKLIHDAKQVGEMSNVDVKAAEERLKQVNDWIKWADDHRIRHCPEPDLGGPKQTSMNLPSWAQDILTAHNAARSAVGAPPLQWNTELQAHATARAGELAQLRQLVHAPREGRGTERENILSAPIGYSPGAMMNLWSKESRHFKPGLFPDVSDTGDWEDVAHYTQMIWPQTTEIGCGYAPGGGFNWLVCRYNPGGNKDGRQVIQPRLIGGDYGNMSKPATAVPPPPPPPPPPR